MLKKWIIVLIMILLCTNLAYANSGTIEGLFPDIKTLDINSTQPRNFEKYSITHYMFDTETFRILDSWASILTAITNFIFMVITFISYSVNYLLMACYKFNIFNLIADIFNSLIWAIRDSIFVPLLEPLLAIVGITIVFNFFVGRITTSWRIITNTLMVLIIGYFFFSNPALSIKMVNELSEEISGSILASTSSVATGSRMTSDDAVVNLGNTFWETTVVKPWQLIQFGDISVGEAEMNNYLKHPLSSPQRKGLANDMGKMENNELFKPEGSVIRLAMVIFIGLVTLAINAFVGILAILTTMLQFGAVIAAMILVLAIVVSLLPNMGLSVTLNGLINTFSFLLGKIGLTILLSMYFAMNTVLYRLSASYGWFFVTVLQLILVATIVLFRKKIMGFAYSTFGGQQRANENIHNRPDLKKELKSTIITAYAAKKMYDDVNQMRERREDRKLTEEYTPAAEEYLMHRYTNEKRAAEVKAEKEGTEVQHSDFVKQVDSRVDKGFTAFDEREITRTTEMMKGLHRQGNDPKNLLTTKIEGTDKNISYNQLKLEDQVESEKRGLNIRKATNEDKINKNIKANKDSKLYNKNIAKQVGRDARGMEITETLIESEDALLSVTPGNENIVLSSSSVGALQEIRKEKLERDYTEMKKNEYSSDNIKNTRKENTRVQDQVVNLNTNIPNFKIKDVKNSNSDIQRRDNSTVSVGWDNGQPVRLDGESVQETSSNSQGKVDVNTNNTRRENLVKTVESTGGKLNVVTENVKNEQKRVENVTENVVNKGESRTETNKNITSVVENQVNKNNNVSNVESKVNAVTENMKNEQKRVENVTENVVNKSESRAETNKNVTNIAENQVNKNNNVSNVESKVNAVTENVKNEQKRVENVTENVVNKSESRAETNKNVTNIVENQVNKNNNVSNVESKVNTVTENVKNEQKRVENLTENVVNKSESRTETNKNITNTAEEQSNRVINRDSIQHKLQSILKNQTKKR